MLQGIHPRARHPADPQPQQESPLSGAYALPCIASHCLTWAQWTWDLLGWAGRLLGPRHILSEVPANQTPERILGLASDASSWFPF